AEVRRQDGGSDADHQGIRLADPGARIQTEACGEEAVEAVAVRQSAHAAVAPAKRWRQSVERLEREAALRREKRAYDAVGRFARDRADRIDQSAAGTDERRDGGEQLALQRREAGEILGVPPPAQLGMAAERAEATAR